MAFGSEGILRETPAIVTRAAVRVVSTGAKAISAKIIDDRGFTSPSRRRHVAVQVVRTFRSTTGIELTAVPPDILG
jgi:hypothetical protein